VGDDPAALGFVQDQPELLPYLYSYLQAFNTLSAGRQRSIIMQPAGSKLITVVLSHPLTFEAIAQYAMLYGITDVEEFDDLCYFVQRLDAIYVECTNRSSARD
jgi:hypothetical protein